VSIRIQGKDLKGARLEIRGYVLAEVVPEIGMRAYLSTTIKV